MATVTPMVMKGRLDIFQIITVITAVTINIEQPVQIVPQEQPIAAAIALIVRVVEVVVSIVQVLLREAPVLREATILSILLLTC